MSVYIIAEAGVNHNGDLNLAFRLCKEAKDAGADAVKFQTWKTEKIVVKSARLAPYQSLNIQNSSLSQYDMLKRLELSNDQFVRIQSYCHDLGIEFLSTPDEEDSLTFLMNLGLPVIKVGSGEITNIPFLRKIGNCGKPVLLSTGMSTIGQVSIAYDTLLLAGAPKVTLLHCTTNYPCPVDEVNLRAMQTLKDAFKCDVGYSDHTLGIEISIAAVALGATVIEKHFTLDRSMEGPDHKASVEPNVLKDMVNSIRNIEKALGDGVKHPCCSEYENSKVVLKSIVAKRPIQKGEILSVDNLVVKRVSGGISATYWDLVIGMVAFSDYDVDEPIKLR